MAGFFGITAYFFFENYGLSLTNAADASLIVSTAPILTILLYDILLKKFDYLEYLGGGTAFIGLILIIYSGSFTQGASVTGNLLSFGAALSWAAYTYFYEKIRNSSIWTTLEVILWGLVFSLPFSLFETLILKKPVSFSSGAVIGIIYLGLFASALGYILWNRGINLWGGKAATLWVYTIPIFTALADIVFLRNFPSWLFYIGAGFIASGMIIVVLREFRKVSVVDS
jgi:drug/metabolite transporter (DMT)-like permease